MNEQDIERHWRARSNEMPDERVDAAIRAAARRELRRRPAWMRYAPLAAAASVGVIAILLVRLSPQENLARVAPPAQPAAPVTPAPVTPAPPSTPPTAAPAEAPRATAAPPTSAAPAAAPPAAPTRKVAPSPPPAPLAEAARAEAQQRSAELRARDSATAAMAAGAADSDYTNGDSVALPARLVELITADAAAAAEVDPQEVEIVSWEPVTWSDGSLGCRTRGEVAIQVLTPGYRVQVLAAGEPLVYHTDREGLVRRCSTVRSRVPR